MIIDTRLISSIYYFLSVSHIYIVIYYLCVIK
nr:MAG TPA: hypothetical protein [Caudoviricetes sp.]